MSDIKLFRLAQEHAEELIGSAMAVERTLQNLIERNLEAMLGVRFLASEHSTGKVHGGRIDSLGIDENGSPVILEYKRSSNENVINQGLFYLDWLLDHRADFKLLTIEKLGREAADSIDWSTPRLICVAGDFTRYDEHAVAQIGRNIELYRYRSYSEGFFILELVNRTVASITEPPAVSSTTTRAARSTAKTVNEYLAQAPPGLKALYELLDSHLLALGDDVAKKATQTYFAYRRIKNFACVEVHPQTQELLVYVKVDPDNVTLEAGFTRDVRAIGHFGTGDLEIRVRNPEELERAKALLRQSYEAS